MPEGGPRYQLIDGDLHMAPSPNLFHQEISRNLEIIIGTYLLANPIGKIFDAPIDVFLTETNVFQPDLLVVSTENFHLLKEDGIHGAPDLVIEILSPSTTKLDLGAKKRVFARCEVQEFWAVDPQTRKVAVYDLHQSEKEPVCTWLEGDEFECKLLPGLKFEVTKFFAR
jgi:Uma2 family endonuclease